MKKTRLDSKILSKLCTKRGKGIQYVREQISKRASRYNISSEAAMVLWAKSEDIGTNLYVRSLPPHMQDQISSHFLPNTHALIRGQTRTEALKHNGRSNEKKIYEKWWVQLLLYVVIGGALATILGGFALRLLGLN